MDAKNLQNLFEGKLNLSGWERYSVKEDFAYDGVSIPGLRQEAYQRDIDGSLVSVGVFHYKNSPAYLAWGLKSAEHCGLHAPLSLEGTVLETRIGCPEIVPIKNGETVTGFTLDGFAMFTERAVSLSATRTWWFYTFYRKTLKKYLPLVVSFSAVVVWTAVHQAWVGFDLHNAMHDFMGAFFLIFGGLKIVSWKDFAREYRLYDPVAKHSMVYAYLYPAAEFYLGIMYQFRLGEELFLNILTVLLLGSASVGVLRVLKNKQEVRCACVGGYFNVPITWFTVFENLLMIGMAVYMQIVWGRI